MTESLNKMPTIFIQETIECFCNKIWEMLPEPKSRQMGEALYHLENDLMNVFIQELFTLGIVEEEKNNEENNE